MSKHAKHVAKHRQAPTRSLSSETPRKALRTTLVLSTLAVTGTGVAVSTGVLAGDGALSTAAADLGSAATPAAQSSSAARGAALATADIARRAETVSRSDRRAPTDPVKRAALSQADGPAMTQTVDLADQDPRTVGRALLSEFGFGADQFGCLDSLWTKESGWSLTADNPSSSAYGIPQALPGSKMASAGADWATNPVTQIRWGLGYIQDRYGSPCSAWAHSASFNWY